MRSQDRALHKVHCAVTTNKAMISSRTWARILYFLKISGKSRNSKGVRQREGVKWDWVCTNWRCSTLSRCSVYSKRCNFMAKVAVDHYNRNCICIRALSLGTKIHHLRDLEWIDVEWPLCTVLITLHTCTPCSRKTKPPNFCQILIDF